MILITMFMYFCYYMISIPFVSLSSYDCFVLTPQNSTNIKVDIYSFFVWSSCIVLNCIKAKRGNVEASGSSNHISQLSMCSRCCFLQKFFFFFFVRRSWDLVVNIVCYYVKTLLVAHVILYALNYNLCFCLCNIATK